MSIVNIHSIAMTWKFSPAFSSNNGNSFAKDVESTVQTVQMPKKSQRQSQRLQNTLLFVLHL